MTDDNESLDATLYQAIRLLRDREPSQDLWPGIAPRLSPRLPRGTMLIRWPMAIAAGIAVALVSASGTLIALHHSGNSEAPVVATSDALVTPVTGPADATLSLAIRDLELQLQTQDRRLDAATRASLHQTLASLDRAIADIVSMQQAHPGSAEIAAYLTATLRRKLDLLRAVSAQTSSQS